MDGGTFLSEGIMEAEAQGCQRTRPSLGTKRKQEVPKMEG